MKRELILLAKEKGFISPVIGKSVEAEWSNKPFYYLWMCELQEWLRDVYDIWVIVDFEDDSEELYVYARNKNGNHLFDIYKNNFSYKEMLEIGLYEALNLIK